MKRTNFQVQTSSLKKKRKMKHDFSIYHTLVKRKSNSTVISPGHGYIFASKLNSGLEINDSKIRTALTFIKIPERAKRDVFKIKQHSHVWSWDLYFYESGALSVSR